MKEKRADVLLFVDLTAVHSSKLWNNAHKKYVEPYFITINISYCGRDIWSEISELIEMHIALVCVLSKFKVARCGQVASFRTILTLSFLLENDRVIFKLWTASLCFIFNFIIRYFEREGCVSKFWDTRYSNISPFVYFDLLKKLYRSENIFNFNLYHMLSIFMLAYLILMSYLKDLWSIFEDPNVS